MSLWLGYAYRYMHMHIFIVYRYLCIYIYTYWFIHVHAYIYGYSIQHPRQVHAYILAPTKTWPWNEQTKMWGAAGIPEAKTSFADVQLFKLTCHLWHEVWNGANWHAPGQTQEAKMHWWRIREAQISNNITAKYHWWKINSQSLSASLWSKGTLHVLHHRLHHDLLITHQLFPPLCPVKSFPVPSFRHLTFMSLPSSRHQWTPQSWRTLHQISALRGYYENWNLWKFWAEKGL